MLRGLPMIVVLKTLLETPIPCRQVASNLNVDPSIVSRVVSRFNATGNVDVQPRSGAPMKLSAFDEFAIMEMHLFIMLMM